MARITWQICIDSAEKMIADNERLIAQLNRSVAFFKKQIAAGIPFPLDDSGCSEDRPHPDAE